jgi:hypothetical protein
VRPALRVGDLVRYRPVVNYDLDDRDAVGVIIDMRAMTPRPAEAKILWNDMPDPRWNFVPDLVTFLDHEG